MNVTKITEADLDESGYYKHSASLVVDGHVDIGANLGTVNFHDSLIAKGGVIAEAGSGIKAGSSIEAGDGIQASRGIQAGWGIQAGDGIDAGKCDLGRQWPIRAKFRNQDT